MSTHSLSSFFVPYIELGSCLQGKFELKRRNKVKKDGRLPGGSLPPLSFICHSCNTGVFFNLWCPVTSVLLDCRRFPVRDFCQEVLSILFSYTFISALYSRKVRRLRSICSLVESKLSSTWIFVFHGGRTDTGNGVTVRQN